MDLCNLLQTMKLDVSNNEKERNNKRHSSRGRRRSNARRSELLVRRRVSMLQYKFGHSPRGNSRMRILTSNPIADGQLPNYKRGLSRGYLYSPRDPFGLSRSSPSLRSRLEWPSLHVREKGLESWQRLRFRGSGCFQAWSMVDCSFLQLSTQLMGQASPLECYGYPFVGSNGPLYLIEKSRERSCDAVR